MNSYILEEFREIWLVDFEFYAPDGEIPKPVCLVATECHSGRTLRVWLEVPPSTPPYSLGKDSLFVAYYASAELGSHLALGWPLPENVLDLFVEFRNLTNGRPTISGAGLLGALQYFGINGMLVTEKEEMRNLILSGGPWTEEEKTTILDYCQEDVAALQKLLPKMVHLIDSPRALIRGRYMKAAARMEFNGIPIDMQSLGILKANWDDLKLKLIQDIDSAYEVYEGTTFKRDRWMAWLEMKQIPWPHLDSGIPDLKDDTFKEMARTYPEIQPMRDLRHTLGQLKLNDLAVGLDGRNRCLLSVYRARTGRNQPSNAKFIFGPAIWLRGLIKPPPGCGIAYIDYEQQEFGIAAALSNDEKMLEAYNSGDPYLAFAKQVGAVPENATKETHKTEREQFKACVLAVQYGMGAESLAWRINQPVAQTRHLLELHHRTYKKFWQWSDAVVDYAMLYEELWTVFGWKIHCGSDANPRMLRNFPVQANGAEMLRLTCCFTAETGIKVCAPVHDAILIEAPLEELDRAVVETQKHMKKASEIILGGFTLRTDAEIVKYPDRYMDPRAEEMWDRVWRVLKI